MACLDILFDQGLFVDELAYALKTFPEEEFDRFEINPKRFEFFMNLPVTQEHLDLITSFAPDGGDDIYFYLMPNWGGEEDELYLNSFDDLVYLRNLEDLYIYAVVNNKSLDLSFSLVLDKLKKVNIWKGAFIQESLDDTLDKLREKNIEIQEN